MNTTVALLNLILPLLMVGAIAFGIRLFARLRIGSGPGEGRADGRGPRAHRFAVAA
jgi:hypothetical protein